MSPPPIFYSEYALKNTGISMHKQNCEYTEHSKPAGSLLPEQAAVFKTWGKPLLFSKAHLRPPDSSSHLRSGGVPIHSCPGETAPQQHCSSKGSHSHSRGDLLPPQATEFSDIKTNKWLERARWHITPHSKCSSHKKILPLVSKRNHNLTWS